MHMSTEYYMRQCKFNRSIGGGMSVETTSWIPEQFAKVGNVVELKMGNEWEDGWEIVSVNDDRKLSNEVNEHSRDYLKQRAASDV
jgi:hypothetical protein